MKKIMFSILVLASSWAAAQNSGANAIALHPILHFVTVAPTGHYEGTMGGKSSRCLVEIRLTANDEIAITAKEQYKAGAEWRVHALTFSSSKGAELFQQNHAGPSFETVLSQSQAITNAYTEDAFHAESINVFTSAGRVKHISIESVDVDGENDPHEVISLYCQINP